ncbi:DUF4229 domain-containing protein [Xylanimonas allomyrinae]|uniref:DUF4229 domain-containing protein n=1 Tax=Xylanimonas allomyrinae TaxID=2509459 RepID=UPI0013A67661|nr:DUF4229 domain-containing protein [Xylanimonas allomyrinae]
MPFLLYSLYRVVVFAAVFALLLLLGAQPVVAGVVGVVVAAAVAYLFLRPARDAAAAWIAARAQARTERHRQGRFARRVAEDESMEDAADDAHER